MRLKPLSSLLGISAGLLIVIAGAMWAAPIERAARFRLARAFGTGSASRVTGQWKKPALGRTRAKDVLGSVQLKLVHGRGLMVETWVNDRGPYSMALDTGAGATILSTRVAREAGVSLRMGRASNLSGLSGSAVVSSRETSPCTLAIGFKENLLPSKGRVVATSSLPEDLDGVIDPTEAFWPLGYAIDLPNSQISAFDPRTNPLRRESVPEGGAVVSWISDGESRRPFVRLSGGDSALLDTGSGFGLAISEEKARRLGMDLSGGESDSQINDVGGARIVFERVKPSTIQLGSLELLRVPTDVLYGTEIGSPVILGRDALRPFRVAFDPVNRLIQFIPA